VADEPTRPRQPRDDPRPRLLIVGPTGVRSVELEPGRTLTVGRGDADLVVDDPELSRQHARLRWDGVLHVTDLGSSNGTLVRGHAVPSGSTTMVGPGEAVELGGTTLVVEHAGLGPRVPTPAQGMDAVHRVAARIAASDISVLLLGETGVGKGVLARRIHDGSPRSGAQFLELNCAALPEQLLESELLGHEKGAFTGATAAKPGLLEVAHGGTVFLDEVGELPPSVQAKLLRVIEERQVMRLGGQRARVTDVRFVAATNRDLSDEVAQGRFRGDLYYRLNGIALYIPPLRERLEEILPLAEGFLAEIGGAQALRFSDEVRAWLLRHPWPGNVRELRNVIRRAVVLCDGPEIAMEHLFVASSQRRRSAGLPPVESSAWATTAPEVPVRPPRPQAHGEDPERREILDALERFAGNQTKAAKHLGISRTTLSARLDTHGIARPKKRS
jgi:transcriptional regulator with PAS, ATPase and Fis domain